ncbi:MAG: triple tyrosine motif-containing protein [Bacteroidales bacterium]|nr:triple tyrosine motif-containing protein [Bacteroidales bacterium]
MTSGNTIRFIITYIILGLLHATELTSQIKSIGQPDVHNFTTEQTHAGAQTWDILEDDKGNVYFGNEKGIIRFDGEEWRLIPLDNNSEVHSITQGSDGRIYVGGYTEIGMIMEDSLGKPIYKNLNHLIPEDYRNFATVWEIHQTRYGIIFQSYEYIFILQDGAMRVIEPQTSFGFSYYVNNNFYIVEKERGLKKLENGALHIVSDAPVFTEDEIMLILPYSSDDLIIGSFSNGLFVLSGSKLQKWNVEMNKNAVSHNLYNGSVNNDHYIFGTVKNGLYITDINGNIIQHLNRLKVLQNNTVLSHLTDSRGNLWVGLDNGIDYLKTSLPISFIHHNFNIETAYTSIIFNGKLYVGTNQGLLTKPFGQLSNPNDIEFDMVENTEGQVWYLAVMDDQLLCAHNYGAFRIEGEKAVKISNSDGVWNFFRMNGVDDRLFSSNYDGFITYEKDREGHWQQTGTIDLDKSLRKIVCDSENNIWVSHDYEGLYKVRLNADFSDTLSMEQFLDTAGLGGDLPYNIHMLDGQFFVSTTNGNYVYDSDMNTFVPSGELNSFFAGLGKISFLHVDHRGNRWYTSDEGAGFYRLLEDGTYRKISTPFAMLSNFLKNNYEHIYVHDYENVFIGSVKGLIHYDPTVNKNFQFKSIAHIKTVSISSRSRDSVLTYQGNKDMETEEAFENYQLAYEWNNLAFTYNCPDPENSDNITYSCRLIGFSDEWSDWNTSNRKEYNNLKDGEYIFEVRANNIYNSISATDRFAFSILTPFYRSTTAYILYTVLMLIMLLTGILYLRRRFEYIRSSEKEKYTVAFQKKEEILKEEQLRAEREIERLRIDKLESSMKHKNKELANSTYHIIRKNKFLNALKQELSNLTKAAKSEFVEQELKKISRKIDRDINNEKNWEVFDRYFDEVHQEFLNRVKEKHPDISPKELRLSAYLRMNISTKEIAPLMNISIRGVEISRYRLRKKLHLDRDDNLTQYLMDI